MLQPTPDLFRGLARSSPWRWRALAFDLQRRPVHGPEHAVHATVERGVGLEVRLADGERHRDAAARIRAGWSEVGTGRHGILELPFAWELPVDVDAFGFVVRRPATATSEDPMWQDYQWVAMLDPVELADGSVHGRCPTPVWAQVRMTSRPPRSTCTASTRRCGTGGTPGGPRSRPARSTRRGARAVHCSSTTPRPRSSRSTSRPGCACTSSTSTATTPVVGFSMRIRSVDGVDGDGDDDPDVVRRE